MKIGKKSVCKKNFVNTLNHILLSFILILFCLILNKINPLFLTKIKDDLFNKSFNFVSVNKFSKKILGRDILYYQDVSNNLQEASLENVNFGSTHKYFNGEKYEVSRSLPIGSFQSGIVIFSGNKDHFNNTLIIQGVDGFNIWYGNLKNINVNLFDYVEKNSLIGEANGDEIYILIEKNNKYYTYEEYCKNKI